MKRLSVIICCLISVILMQCKSASQTLENDAIKIGKAYYQNWVAGIQDGGSGFNLYLSIIEKPQTIVLDSAFFRGKKSKLEIIENNIALARFVL